jgi:drug/metabolite transporter (DMT)-like permease
MSGQQILKAHAALLFVNVLYGANHVLAKGVMPQFLDPNTFILLRVGGAVLLFWILFLSQKRKPIDRTDYWRFAAAGLFGVAVNQLFFFHGLNLSSALNAGIIMALNPLMVFVLAAVLTREKLTAHNYTGVVIGAAGAILLTLSSGSLPGASLLGDVFLLINALSYAFYLVLSKPLLLKYSPIQVITYVFSIGLVLLLLFPPTWSNLANAHFEQIPTSAWYKMVLLF